MPWRGPEFDGDFPTLGFEVGQFIEDTCVIPDGDRAGDPFLLTIEMWRFLLRHYRVDPGTGRFTYRRSQLVRPQKWGKGPLGAAIVTAEAEGPVLFAGWDAKGEPVGRPWATPWIQLTATSEDQTANVMRALIPMIELGPLKFDIPDTGLTRINLDGGGLIEPVTSSSRTRFGQRVTHALQDETHLWTHRSKMTQVADTQRRNLAGTGGRSIEYTNAWDPTENSVAQLTFEAKAADIYRDMAAPPKGLRWENRRDRRKMMQAVYGDSVFTRKPGIRGWIDLDRIDAEFAELAERDVNQGLRFFCNMVVAGSGSAVHTDRWSELLEQRAPEPGERIGVGFDGSISEDCTVLIGTTGDGFQFVLGAWTRPPNTPNWRVPRKEVADEVHRAFSTYDVGLMYCDEAKWWSEIEDWQETYPERVLGLPTNSDRRFAPLVDRWLTAIEEGAISHGGDQLLTDHVLAAQKVKARARDAEDDNRTLYVLTKPADGRKIDGAVAAVLSLAAAHAMESVEAGVPPFGWS